VLDRQTDGYRWLDDERVALVLAKAIWIGEFERKFYQAHARSIMPNHAHLLITPRVSLPVITRWLKGSTARTVN
jgi:REP element-mobilizing transposase RayT